MQLEHIIGHSHQIHGPEFRPWSGESMTQDYQSHTIFKIVQVEEYGWITSLTDFFKKIKKN